MKSPPLLYDLCLKKAVQESVTICQFCKKEFRSLPNNVLFDFYYTMLLEKRLCLLAVEFNELDVFSRMLNVQHKRVKLLKSFQQIIDHGSNVADELISQYRRCLTNPTENAIDLGIRLGSFFNEGGWYRYTIETLDITEELCKKHTNQNVDILKKHLECYHKRIYAETMYCEFKAAEITFNSSLEIVKKLEESNFKPNLAGLYANFSNLFFHRSEYDTAYSWAKQAIVLLTDKSPIRVVIEVLRLVGRACVIKRYFKQAGLVIRQSINLAKILYEHDQHPRFADVLLDYGYYLLNYDSIQESVKIYERALQIRKNIFEKNNILLALAHEDMAYAQYVNEYSSGRFYVARENAERAIRLLERILPDDHLLLSSAKRVKALILEEIALDMREGNTSQLQDRFLNEAEELHRAALDLSYKAFGEKNVQTAKHYGNLGRLYQSMKLYNQAELMHLKAIAIKEELLGNNDYEVGLSIGHLASLYNYHMKRHHDAEKLYIRSLDINLKLFGDTYSGFEYDYRGLINVYSKLSDQSNVLLYQLKMRDWLLRREEIKANILTDNDEILSIDEIIKQFISMY